jgi:VWFA-related protein
MNRSSPLLVVVGACLAVVTLVAEQKTAPPPRTTFVELDAVVVDGKDRPVRGLHPEDFQIKEDGRAVAVTSITEVSAAGMGGADDGRSVVLLLDDTMGPAGTSIVQEIARQCLAPAKSADSIAVVRLTHREDEAVGSPQMALDRIGGYRSGALPYFLVETTENALQAVTSMSKQLETIAHRRTAVICIGRRSVCDPDLGMLPEKNLMWPYWRDALRATARADVNVHFVDPVGLTAAASGEIDARAGFVEHTGGVGFSRSNNLTRMVNAIWDDASHYYLVGYTPTAGPRDLHMIDVKMNPRGLHVRARRNRGD